MQKQNKEKEFLKVGDLAKRNKVRFSTIKFYSELRLLPFKQDGKRLARKYPAKEASKRLQEILALRAKGKTIDDIINELIKK